jgi:hypothetical protein
VNVCKLLDAAQARWRKSNSPELIASSRCLLLDVDFHAIVWKSLLTALAIVAIAALSQAARADASQVEWVPTPLCSRPAGADPAVLETLMASAPSSDKGVPALFAWRAGEERQAAIERLHNQVVDAEPSAFVGVFSDHLRQELVVVVDPTTPNPTRFLPAVQDAVSGTDLNVTVRPGCFPLTDLEAVRAQLETRDWVPPDLENYGFMIDPAASRVVVQLPADRTDIADALTGRFGGLVDVEFFGKEGGLQGRMNDGSPHYGGAAIGPASTSTCTAGFAMDKNGGRWMVAAAHCAMAAGGYSGLSWYSGGPTFYGYRFTYNTWWGTYQDMTLLGSDQDLYSRVIHVDPCCPSTRLVTARSDPSTSTFVCISGMVSKAKCNVDVINTDWSGSMSGKAYTNMVYAFRGDVTISQEGDSGAPIYTRIGSGSARIRGMHIGDPFSSRHVTVFFKVSTIESVTGAVTATTCCNAPSY